jgi:hypothetical protein
VLDQVWIAMIGKASGKAAKDSRRLFHLAEEQCSGIGGDCSAIETRDQFTSV